MKPFYTFVYILTLVFSCTQFALAQKVDKLQVPVGLKKAKVLIVIYNYSDWSRQFVDSTHDQWVTKRYGKELLYNNYREALTKAIGILERKNIEHKVMNARAKVDHACYDYLFDYKQLVVDNHVSKVANNHMGGFFFVDTVSGKKYSPLVGNKKIIGKLIKRGLRNRA